MRCSQARELMHHYLDGRLPAASAALLDAHINTCIECQKELAHLRYIAALIAKLPPYPVSRGFAPGVIAGIQSARAAYDWHDHRYPCLDVSMAVRLAVVVAGSLLVFIYGVMHSNLAALLAGYFVAWHSSAPAVLSSYITTSGETSGIQDLMVYDNIFSDGMIYLTLLGCLILILSLGLLWYLLRTDRNEQHVQAGR